MGRKLQDQLDALTALRANPSTAAAQAELAQALGSKRNLVVATAAQVVGDAGLTDLVPALVAAFARFVANGAKVDKGCHAKSAIVAALIDLDQDIDELFLRGAYLVQMEPIWGGQADTAIDLRARCAEGLARASHPQLPRVLADLLADPERPVRIAAARVAAFAARPELTPLLRLRARVGDEPEVLAECFRALITLEPADSSAFVAAFLDHDDPAIGDFAALALGTARNGDTLTLLRAWHERNAGQRAEIATVAIASLRLDAAYDYLLALIADGPSRVAHAALAALGPYRELGTLRERVARAVQDRDEAEITAAFTEAFTDCSE